VIVGVDDAPPYRVFWDNSQYPAGAEVTLIATIVDPDGRRASDRRSIVLGDRP